MQNCTLFNAKFTWALAECSSLRVRNLAAAAARTGHAGDAIQRVVLQNVSFSIQNSSFPIQNASFSINNSLDSLPLDHIPRMPGRDNPRKHHWRYYHPHRTCILSENHHFSIEIRHVSIEIQHFSSENHHFSEHVRPVPGSADLAHLIRRAGCCIIKSTILEIGNQESSIGNQDYSIET